MSYDPIAADLLRENGILKEWIGVYRDEIKYVLEACIGTPEQRQKLLERLEKLNAVLR